MLALDHNYMLWFNYFVGLKKDILMAFDNGVSLQRIVHRYELSSDEVKKILIQYARIVPVVCRRCKKSIKNHRRCCKCDVLVHGVDICQSCSMSKEERKQRMLTKEI